ncbi:MAG: hypothetical protein HYV26_17305, partial [Candidatus Hydrogenedentes bacterium]|nr:hypothetical protein [Candidatus Hydrogenedentota bacterium]
MTVPPKKKTNFRVRLLVAGVTLLVLVTGLLVLSSLEWIQHAVIAEIAERAIVAKVDALGISLGNPLALERITVRDPNILEGSPLLAASGLTLSHGWNPFSARPLRRLSLQHLELHLLDS